MDIKIGKLRITTKKLVPGKTTYNFLGFGISWMAESSLSYVNNGYLGNPDIYTAINKVTRTCGFAPFKVFRVKDKKKHQLYKSWTGSNATPESILKAYTIKSLVYEEDTNHPMNRLLERPNRHQKAREFTENSIGFKLITGERIWFVVKVEGGAQDGSPFEIYNLPPQHMAVASDGTPLGIKNFTLMLGNHKVFMPEEIIFSKYWNPNFDGQGSQLRGLSPWKAGQRLMTISNSGLTRSAAMLQNAGSAGVLYNKEMDAPEGMAIDLKNKVNNEILNPDNANAIAVANGDLGYISFGLKGSEMELQELMKLNRNRIASIINVPPILLDPDSSSYNNILEAKKELITGACTPELDSLREDWNEVAKLYGDDIYVDYDLSVYPELQADMDKMSQIAERAWWTTGNEKRLMMYQDEDNENPMMNEYLIPSGLVPISDLGLNAIDNVINGANDQNGV